MVKPVQVAKEDSNCISQRQRFPRSNLVGNQRNSSESRPTFLWPSSSAAYDSAAQGAQNDRTDGIGSHCTMQCALAAAHLPKDMVKRLTPAIQRLHCWKFGCCNKADCNTLLVLVREDKKQRSSKRPEKRSCSVEKLAYSKPSAIAWHCTKSDS